MCSIHLFKQKIISLECVRRGKTNNYFCDFFNWLIQGNKTLNFTQAKLKKIVGSLRVGH